MSLKALKGDGESFRENRSKEQEAESFLKDKIFK